MFPNIPDGWNAIITLLLSGLITWIITNRQQKVLEARVKPQNDKDTIEALEKAFHLLGMDLDEQLAMKERISKLPAIEEEVATLRDLMENTEIRIHQTTTVSLKDGKSPRAEITSVEAVRVVKPKTPAIVQ